MTQPLSYDIFCRVVDNYGDIGVCWRLARQLAREHGARVRLWVDDLAALRLLCAQVDAGRPEQHVAGVDILHWKSDFPPVAPATVVVEAFGCGLPERYVEAFAARRAPGLWIVLEYLSAERWVPQHHGLPSPHPRLPVQRYFFFPGFEAGTGGVLREAGRTETAAGAAQRNEFWTATGFAPVPAQAAVVSLFSYAHAPLQALLGAWAQSAEPLVAAVAPGPAAAATLDFLGERGPAQGRVLRRGSLEVRMLPFVEQPRYDALLRACDCNFVRGEDSFVQAQ